MTENYDVIIIGSGLIYSPSNGEEVHHLYREPGNLCAVDTSFFPIIGACALRVGDHIRARLA